jgi:hypothetical protein
METRATCYLTEAPLCNSLHAAVVLGCRVVGGTVLVGKGLDLMPTLISEMKNATNGAEFVLATLVSV